MAGTLTTVAYLPQVIKVFREKHTKSISLWMYLVNVLGMSSWIMYGLLVGSYSILCTNTLILVMVLAILVMKLRYDSAS